MNKINDTTFDTLKIDNYLVTARYQLNFCEKKPCIIPKNTIFLLGDNRNSKLDGRLFGFIQLQNIHGRVLFSF